MKPKINRLGNCTPEFEEVELPKDYHLTKAKMRKYLQEYLKAEEITRQDSSAASSSPSSTQGPDQE
jgi:hypothetical protein